MDKKFKIPPIDKNSLTEPNEIAKRLASLIGTPFPLTGKSRTDGSNIRKRVACTLSNHVLPQAAVAGSFDVIPPKGVPKILLEYIDTYIVTTGTNYNLQVWNRNPSTESVQVQYANGDTLQSSEVRFVLIKVDPQTNSISTVLVLSPDYIVSNFGVFGKPTKKFQLIISNLKRQEILQNHNRILFYDDSSQTGNDHNLQNLSSYNIHDKPNHSSLLPLSKIKEIVSDNVIGHSIAPGATKTRGQMLEKIIATALGYTVNDSDLLAGGYPDIRNQALEVKIQDSPTVDLGKYSPEFEESIPECNGFTTRTMRYLIVLTNPDTNIVEGAILCPGDKLGLHFTYVADESYKCQRSIPMSFIDSHQGKSVYNP